MRHVNLSTRLNHWFLEQDGVVFLHENGVEVGFQFWLPERASSTQDQIDTLFETYRDIIESSNLERGRIRFMTMHRPATPNEIMNIRFPETEDPMQKALIAHEVAANRERQEFGDVKMHETFCFIHIRDRRPGVSISDQRSYNETEFDEIMQRAHDERRRMMSAFNTIGIPCTPLVGDEPYHLMYRWYNAGSIIEEPPPFDWNAELPNVTKQELLSDPSIRPRTLRSQICQSDILAERNDFLQNENARIVVADMTNYGKRGHAGMSDLILAAFRNFTYWHIVDIHFAPESSIKSRVERNVKDAQKQAGNTDGMGVDADATRMTADLMETLLAGGKFVRFGMSLVVVTETDQETRRVRTDIRNLWSERGQHQMSFGKYSNWEQFVFNLAPYGGKFTDFTFDMDVSSVAYFLPYFGPWHNPGGVTLGIFENEYGGQQRISLPKSSESVSHMAVIGSSRSGKSFTVQKLLMNLFMYGASLRIMDVKDDYQPLAQWLKGQFIRCEPGATFKEETVGPNGETQPPGTFVSYNIFEGRRPTDRFPELSSSDERDIVGFLKTLIGTELDGNKDTLLLAAVQQFTKIRHQMVRQVRQNEQGQWVEVMVNTFKGAMLEEFVKFLFSMDRIGEFGFDHVPNFREHARELALKLNPYTNGVYGNMFNSPTTINIRNRVTLYDLSGLKREDPMNGVIMSMVNKQTWDDARKRPDEEKKNRIVLLSEETGITGKIPEVKQMLESIVVAGAAYNLMLIIVAQNYEQIQALSGVLNNVSRVILGRCEPKEAELIAELLDLNPGQLQALRKLERRDNQYNELLVREWKPDNTYQIGKIRFRPTHLEYALFSSDHNDKIRRSEIMREAGGDMTYAVKRLVKERIAALAS